MSPSQNPSPVPPPDAASAEADAGPTVQRTPRQVAALQRRVLRELVEANVLGGLLVLVFNVVFASQRIGPFLDAQTAIWFIVGSGLGFGLTLVASWWVTRPLVRWLADLDAPPASQRLKIAVVLQPAAQSALVASLWFLAAVGFGLMLALWRSSPGVGPQVSWLRFAIVFVGTCIGGIATTAILYLRIEETWRPWMPALFPDDDPTSLPLPPMTQLKSRLRITFALGTAVPLIVIAAIVTFRDVIGLNPTSVTRTIWYFAVAGIVIGAILSVNVRRSIMEPIDRLKAAMELVRLGDTDVSVPVDRVDELGRLEAGFNDMVEGVRVRESLEDTLRRQVGSQVAALAIDGDTAERRGRLGGEVRYVTALFVDLVSFSAMAEREPPAAIAGKLNMVFGVVVEAVERHRGLVNKFLGDAVLAVFGAPTDDDRHAVHALAAAEEIARRLERLDFDFGIGLSSGEAFAGNVGSEGRYEYTVIGDPVNVASRLQELTRRLSRRVLLSGRTAELVRDEGGNRYVAALVPLSPTVLRGRSEPTEVFSLSPQLWREPGDPDPAQVRGARRDPAPDAGDLAGDVTGAATGAAMGDGHGLPGRLPALDAAGSGSAAERGAGLRADVRVAADGPRERGEE